MAKTNTNKACFVISPIGDDGSEIRRRADQILKHVIEPSIRPLGYEPIRADHIAEPGLITSQVIQHIVDDPLVIADLTGSNPNVFYELAIRHAIRKPLVQLIQKGEKIPFDVAGMRTVPIDHKDLDSVDQARADIINQINAVEGKEPGQIETPITVSIELQSLRQSENPEQRSLAEFVSAVQDLRSDLSSIEKRISEPSNLFPPSYFASLADRFGISDSRQYEALSYELHRISKELRSKMSEVKDIKDRKDFETLVYRLEDLIVSLGQGGPSSWVRAHP